MRKKINKKNLTGIFFYNIINNINISDIMKGVNKWKI